MKNTADCTSAFKKSAYGTEAERIAATARQAQVVELTAMIKDNLRTMAESGRARDLAYALSGNTGTLNGQTVSDMTGGKISVKKIVNYGNIGQQVDAWHLISAAGGIDALSRTLAEKAPLPEKKSSPKAAEPKSSPVNAL